MSNIQTHVLVVTGPPPGNRVWVIGTETKRGFTPNGARMAAAKLSKVLKKGYTVSVAELEPIAGLLALQP